MEKTKLSKAKMKCNTAYSFHIDKYVLRDARKFCRENHITLPTLITLILKEVSMLEIDRIFRDSEGAINQLMIKNMERNSRSYWGKVKN